MLEYTCSIVFKNTSSINNCIHRHWIINTFPTKVLLHIWFADTANNYTHNSIYKLQIEVPSYNAEMYE